MVSNLKYILRSFFPASEDTRDKCRVIAILVKSTSTTSACVSSPAIAFHPTVRQLSSSRGARVDGSLEIAIPALSLASAATGAIPLAGPPLKAVVDGLLGILKAFDGIRRNENDALRLRLRLQRLDLRISEVAARGSPFEHPRNILNQQLRATEKKLREALDLPKVRFQSVADAVQECCDDIDNYLQEYSLAMVNRQEVVLEAIQLELRRTREQRAIKESTIMTFDIYIMDAMGVKHRIPMAMARTMEQFKRAIGGVYIPNSQRDLMHRRYLDADQFDLGINNGNRVMEINRNEDLQDLVQPGTTVLLSIVILRKRVMEKYRCPLCMKWNDKMTIHSAAECTNSGCRGYIQLTEANTRSEVSCPTYKFIPNSDMSILSNIHIKRFTWEDFPENWPSEWKWGLEDKLLWPPEEEWGLWADTRLSTS